MSTKKLYDNMGPKVSQKIFDEIVRENMEEFEMDVQDAIKDSVVQFKAQGADLSAVIIDLMALSLEADILNTAADQLKAFADAGLWEDKEIIEVFKVIQRECKRGISYQLIAANRNCYYNMMEVLHSDTVSVDVQLECLRTLIVLMSKQPDILDAEGVAAMVKILRFSENNDVRCLLLKWTKECCTLHEMNRQNIVNIGILDYLIPMMTDANSKLLSAILGVLRTFVLDDDVRVEFGRGQEHARTIANDSLETITELIQKFQDEATVLTELLLTLSVLLVRSVFCARFVAANGIPMLNRTLKEFSTNDRLIRQCFKVLKAVAGNDDCKAKMIKAGSAPLIVDTLNMNQTSARTVALGLGCIVMLTLRSPANSEIMYEAGAPTCIVECMKQHPDNEAVHKNAGWAIRNMVSRSRHQNKEFLRLGAEALLKSALPKFERSEFDIKAALRDLECEIDLREEWTGTGGMLTTSATKAQ